MKKYGLAVAAVALMALPAQAALIVNGGFESPVIAANNYYTFSSESDPALPGWTVISGDVDVNSSNGFGTPFSGAQWLDLSGNVRGSIAQSFATTPGASYQLSFAYANNVHASSAMATMSVLGAGINPLLTADLYHVGSVIGNMNYYTYSSSFVANSSLTTLQFAADFPNTGSGLALDAISVVPEPSGLELCLPIAAMVGCWWRREALRKRLGGPSNVAQPQKLTTNAQKAGASNSGRPCFEITSQNTSRYLISSSLSSVAAPGFGSSGSAGVANGSVTAGPSIVGGLSLGFAGFLSVATGAILSTGLSTFLASQPTANRPKLSNSARLANFFMDIVPLNFCLGRQTGPPCAALPTAYLYDPQAGQKFPSAG